MLPSFVYQLESDQIPEVIAAFNTGISRLWALKLMVDRIQDIDKPTALFMFTGACREEARKILHPHGLPYIDGDHERPLFHIRPKSYIHTIRYPARLDYKDTKSNLLSSDP